MSLNLNIGCGTDYKEGFVNIDGSPEVKTDKIVDISTDSLRNHFSENSVDYILASDIIEHHFHWEAIKILKDFYFILKKDGILEMRMPDCDTIINSQLPMETKLTLLFGGQDVPQKNDPIMDKSRKKHPEYFCHKYGWNIDRMNIALSNIGYKKLRFKNVNTNFICQAIKI